MNRLILSIGITGFLVLALGFMFPGTDHLKKKEERITELNLAMFKPVQTPAAEEETVREIEKTPVPLVSHLTQEIVPEVPEVKEVEISSSESPEVSPHTVMEDVHGIIEEGEMIFSYKALVLERIGRKKIYPSAARRRTQEGEVEVHIKIGRNGVLVLSKIIESSGYKLLDLASLRAVKSASPFPFPPEEQVEIEFSFIMDYRLE